MEAFPTLVMIGRDGKVVAHQIGFGGDDEVLGMAAKAGLAEAAPKK